MNALLPDAAQLSVFLTASLLMGMTPGPDMLLVLNRSLGIGFGAGMITMAGIVTGALAHTVAAALGLSVLLVRYPVTYEIMRYGGALYLAWLGWQILRHGNGLDLHPTGNKQTHSWGRLYRQAVLTNLLNPKVALFILAFLPQFIPASATNPAMRILVLGVMFFGIGIVIMTGLSALAGRLRLWLAAHPSILRGQATVTGLLMLVFAVGLVWSGGAGISGSLSGVDYVPPA